jgi:hypothetical protein
MHLQTSCNDQTWGQFTILIFLKGFVIVIVVCFFYLLHRLFVFMMNLATTIAFRF